jgi:hypothetical protein
VDLTLNEVEQPATHEEGHNHNQRQVPKQASQPELKAGAAHGSILPLTGFAGPARSRALARRPPARDADGMVKPLSKLEELMLHA